MNQNNEEKPRGSPSGGRPRGKHPSQMTPQEFARYQEWLNAGGRERNRQNRDARGQNPHSGTLRQRPAPEQTPNRPPNAGRESRGAYDPRFGTPGTQNRPAPKGPNGSAQTRGSYDPRSGGAGAYEQVPNRPRPNDPGRGRSNPGGPRPNRSMNGGQRDTRSNAQNRADPRGRRQLTPEERRRRQEAADRRRSDEEYERHIRVQEKREKTRARLERKKSFKLYVLRLAIAFVSLAVLVGVGIYLIFRHAPDKPLDSGNIYFYYGGTRTRTAAAADCVAGDGIYICFNDLANYLDMKESGSAEEMKFLIVGEETPETSAGTGREESVTFVTGEHKIVVNGQIELLDVPNRLEGEKIWVSSSFVTDWMNNLTFQYKENRREVRIARVIDEEATAKDENKKTHYLPVSFRLKSNAPLDALEENAGIGLIMEATQYELNFQTDVSEYEMYMNPTGDLRDAFLVLVNKESPLTARDVPRDLVNVANKSISRDQLLLREYPERALEAMFREMHYNGFYDMAVYTAYRSYEEQSTAFEEFVKNELTADPSKTREEAEDIVAAYSTRPGTDEHQTGLAVDMDNTGLFTSDFAWTRESYWLQDNAWKFGFILRYPQGKEEVTGTKWEAWHFRYVGRYHAKIIHDNNLCLEEYLSRISY